MSSPDAVSPDASSPDVVFDVEGPVLGELFVVTADDTGVVLSGPCGPEAWHIEVPAGDDPMTVARDVVDRVLGPPLLLHSTSWRRAKGAVTLTFLVVVDPRQVHGLESRQVAREDLARG